MALAYKAYEIEEFVDIYFYRRLGYLVALAARVARLSPNAVTVIAGVIGAAGGALLAWPGLAPAGVGLLVLHGVVDSADGQLARMTGRTSELGRILDGLAGYATHTALYLALAALVVRDGGGAAALALTAVSALCTAVQAQMYDYHRTAYAAFVLKGRVPVELMAPSTPGLLGGAAAAYAGAQRALLGLHRTVERAIAERADGGAVREADRSAYRACFYRRVIGWNLLGDNVRRYTIAACVLAGHPTWFMAVTLGPLNAVTAVLWWAQQRADRRFLEAPDRAARDTR